MVLSYRKRLLQTTFIPERGDKPNAQSPFSQINQTFGFCFVAHACVTFGNTCDCVPRHAGIRSGGLLKLLRRFFANSCDCSLTHHVHACGIGLC